MEKRKTTEKKIVAATVFVFMLLPMIIAVPRNSPTYDTTREFTINISGINTGTADAITGQLSVARLRSLRRNDLLPTFPLNHDVVLHKSPHFLTYRHIFSHIVTFSHKHLFIALIIQTDGVKNQRRK